MALVPPPGAQNLRRVGREFTIDLYLRPPVTHFRLMDYHLMARKLHFRCRAIPGLMLGTAIQFMQPPLAQRCCHMCTRT